VSSHPPNRQLLTAQLLGPSLLLGEISNDRHLEAFTVKGVDHHNEPEDEEQETHHRPQKQIDQAEEGQPANNVENDIDCNPGNAQEDGLPGVEAHVGVLVEGFNDEEDDRRNERNVGKSAGSIVREAGLVRFRHGSSFQGRDWTAGSAAPRAAPGEQNGGVPAADEQDERESRME